LGGTLSTKRAAASLREEKERTKKKHERKGEKKRILCMNIHGHSLVAASAKATRLLLTDPYSLCAFIETVEPWSMPSGDIISHYATVLEEINNILSFYKDA